MIITCEACNTSFNLDDKMIKPSGSKVRCSICANIFTAFPQAPPIPEPEPAPPAAIPDAPEPEETIVDDDLPAFDALADESADLATAGDDLAADGQDLDFDAAEDAAEDLDFDLGPVEEPAIEESATVIADLEDEDLDFDLTFDESPADADDQEVAIADLGADLDLDLDAGPVADDDAATMIADLDDDEFNLSMDDVSGAVETTITDLDREDLGLDLSDGADAAVDQSEAATMIASLDDQTLDLDEDFSLAPDDAPAAGTADDDLDLDLDIDLPEDDAAAETVVAEIAADDDLSLDFELEPAADASETQVADDGVLDDLDLSLDMDEDEAALAVSDDDRPILDDDLDMSSLEGLLDDDDDGAAAGVDETSELELALDDADTPADTVALDASLDGLELDLDDGGEAPTVDDGMALDTDEDAEIDLSEIEKMLEEPESDAAKIAAVPDQDLDLDIEASLETEKWMSDSADADGGLVKDEELDLSELEQVLDDVDTETADEDAIEEQELELDLSEDARSAASGTVAADDDLEFDLSAFETDEPAAGVRPDAGDEAEDMALDFEIEEDAARRDGEDEGLEETVALNEADALSAEPAAAAAPVKPAFRRPAAQKKGSRKSLVAVLILLLLGAAGYGVYYLAQSGVEIPFLSDYMKPKVQDPGNLKLTTFDISSKFSDNAHVGKLFVITGKVKNGYTVNRGIITLMGKLFSTGKVAVNQERVYAGNVLSDLELANLEWDKIQARLGNRMGDNRSNEKIEPGKSIPFMVVFSGLPDDLEEFTIEVTGSTPLK